MYSSFYTAAIGAATHQSKMNVISNNMANINTTAYKSKTPIFSDLMYANYTDAQAGHMQVGKGLRLDKTSTDFNTEGAFNPTDGSLDFAAQGDGFFAVQDLEGEDILYTRDGRFMMTNMDGTMYLTNSTGKVVLNSEGEPIDMTGLDKDAELSKLDIGVFKIPVKDGMMPDGYNNFKLVEKNGEPEAVESPKLLRGYLETSNVDMATQMSLVIEAQRAYSYSLKMLQTSDEVEQEVNSLRR